MGGQWIGKGHDQMYKLVAEAGLQTFPTYTYGKNILRLDGKNSSYKGETLPLGLFALLSALKLMYVFDRKSSKISLENPWLMENTYEMDNRSIGNWIEETISNKKARILIKRTAEAMLCKM